MGGRGAEWALRACLVLGSLILSEARPSAQEPASFPPEGRRSMQASRLAEGETVSLDGILDEPVWKRAVPATDFVQQDPDFGAEPTERTEVRIAVDSRRLYMGVTCFDSEPDQLLGNTMKRDEFLSSDDRFMWVFDYRVEGATAPNRFLSTRSSFGWGGVFSGQRKVVESQVNVRPRPGVGVVLEAEWNWVDLAEGDFQTRLYRMVVDNQFSPWTQLSNNIQFDSVSGLLGWQSRFRWILSPGNDLYLVYFHNWLDDPLDPLDRFRTEDRSAAAKVIYTHRF